MAAPTGSEAQIGYKFASARDSYGQDIWQGPVNKFFRFKSMSGMFGKRKLERVDNMDPSNQVLKGSATEVAIAPKFQLNPDTNSIAPLLSHFLSKNPTITTPSGATNGRQWVYTPFEYGDSANSTDVESLIMEGTDNDGNPILIDGARMSEFGIKIANGKIIDCDMSFLACHDTFTSDATQLTLGVGAYNQKPIVRGHWATARLSSTLKVKVTAGAGGGFDGTVKWTTATYAGSTTTQIVFGKWYRLPLDDGSRLGVDPHEDVYFCFPTGTGTLTTNDEWSFTSTRTLATPSFSTLDVLNAVGVEFTVGGTVYYVHDLDIKLMRPRKANMVAGSKYALAIQKNGPYSASLAINRDRDDRDFLKKIITAEAFAVAVKMYGNPIETGIDQLFQIDFPNCQVSDDQRDVTSPNTLQEKIDIIPFRTGSSDIYTLTLVNSLTAL